MATIASGNIAPQRVTIWINGILDAKHVMIGFGFVEQRIKYHILNYLYYNYVSVSLIEDESVDKFSP